MPCSKLSLLSSYRPITLTTSGGNGDGGSSTADFAKSLFTMLPPMTDAFGMVGQELPGFMQGAGKKVTEQIAAQTLPENKNDIQPDTQA